MFVFKAILMQTATIFRNSSRTAHKRSSQLGLLTAFLDRRTIGHKYSVTPPNKSYATLSLLHMVFGEELEDIGREGVAPTQP